MSSRIKSKSLLVLSLLFAIPLSANADPYVGIHIGQADSVLPQENDEEELTSFEINLGLGLSENFSIEASYLNLGETEINRREWSMTGFTGSLLAYMPLAETASIFARAGFYNWDVSVARISSNRSIYSDALTTDEGLDFLYGAGIKFDVADGFSAVFEYRSFAFLDADENASNISLGVQYTFY